VSVLQACCLSRGFPCDCLLSCCRAADAVTWSRPNPDTMSILWDAPQGLTHSETTALLEALDYVCKQFAQEVRGCWRYGWCVCRRFIAS
jgi:hypothetical protein